jgi:branched-subunit amino acid ABC-type transport system permease component
LRRGGIEEGSSQFHDLPSANVLIQVAIVGLLTGGVYALMAGGLSPIFGVMRVINIAHGAFLVLSAYIAYWLSRCTVLIRSCRSCSQSRCFS